MAVDFTTDVGLIRALIPDTELLPNPNRPGSEPEYMFSDEHLDALLTAAGGHVKLAAADALEVLGTSEAIIGKVIQTEDLRTDGAKLMNAFLIRSTNMRARALAEIEEMLADTGGFDIIEFVPMPYHGEPR